MMGSSEGVCNVGAIEVLVSRLHHSNSGLPGSVFQALSSNSSDCGKVMLMRFNSVCKLAGASVATKIGRLPHQRIQICRYRLGASRPIIPQNCFIQNQRRYESSTELMNDWEIMTFKELSRNQSSADVREPDEYADGHVPGAVNWPIKSSPDGIFLDPESFEEKFNFVKPGLEKRILFYCRSGIRSRASAALAKKAGYHAISEYRGGFIDWLKYDGPTRLPKQG